MIDLANLLAAGLETGLTVWGLVAATGFGAVLQLSLVALWAIMLLGGAYLLWLARHAGCSELQRDDAQRQQGMRGGCCFLRDLLFNLSNPKSVLAGMAALSLGGGHGDGIAALAVATALYMLLGLANNLGLSLVFSTSGMMASFRRLRQWIEATVSGIFARAGLDLIRWAVAR